MSGRANARPQAQTGRGELHTLRVTFPADSPAASAAINLQGGTLAPVLIAAASWPSPTPRIRIAAGLPDRKLRTLFVNGAAVDLVMAAGSAVPIPADIRHACGAFLMLWLVDSGGANAPFSADVTVDVLLGSA